MAKTVHRGSEQRMVLRHFVSAVKELKKSLAAAQRVWPGAEIYVAVNSINLMSGPHHEGKNADARPDRILASESISGLDVGDW